MAAITKKSNPGPRMCSPSPNTDQLIGGLVAGEAIGAGDNVYTAGDGKVYRATGAAANAAARVRGQALNDSDSGEAVTIGRGLMFDYAAGLTAGTDYYLSGTTPGGLDTVASTGGTTPVGYAWNATIVQFFYPR